MNLGLLIIRLVVGLTLAAHGSQKLFGWFGGGGLAGTGAFFENRLQFRPGRTHALMAGACEFGGGLALALGLFTPLAAAVVVGVMVVAGWAAHRQNGFFITKGGYEYTVILAGVAAGLAFAGPARFSVDRALGWHLDGPVWGVVAVLFGVVAGAGVMAGRGRLRETEPAGAALGDQAGTGAGTGVQGGRHVAMERSQGHAEAERA
jgi:putative oxidoreductase